MHKRKEKDKSKVSAEDRKKTKKEISLVKSGLNKKKILSLYTSQILVNLADFTIQTNRDAAYRPEMLI